MSSVFLSRTSQAADGEGADVRERVDDQVVEDRRRRPWALRGETLTAATPTRM